MFIRYSRAMCAGGLVTGLAYYQLSKKRPFLISAQPQPAKNVKIKDISEVLSETTKSYILNKYPNLHPVIQYGIPSYDNLRIHETYLSSYNRKNKVSDWVMQHLTKDMLEGEAKRSNYYKVDTAIHPYFRSTNEDYQSSGFDKGHLAKAENYKSSQKAMNETFFMSNMAPQDPKFNRYELWKVLENHVANLVKQKYGNYKTVSVCLGPLYLARKLTDEQEANLLEEKENWEPTEEQETNFRSKPKKTKTKRIPSNEQENNLLPNNKENEKKRIPSNEQENNLLPNNKENEKKREPTEEQETNFRSKPKKTKTKRELTEEQETNFRSKPKQTKRKRIPSNEQENNLLLNNKENEKKRGENNDMDQKNYVIYKVIGENHVAVPTHFFKVLLCEVEKNSYDMEAYVIPNKPNNPKSSKISEDMALKEGSPNKPDDPKQSKMSEDRALKEVTPNKQNDTKKSKTSEDSRLKEFLVPKDAIEKAAGFIIFPELQESEVRRIKLKESASPEYYNN